MARTIAWVRSEAPMFTDYILYVGLGGPLHQNRSRSNTLEHLIEAEHNRLGREIGREGLGSSRSRC